MRAIHQLVVGFREGDAISNEALHFRGLFRAWGHAADIFAEPHAISPRHKKTVRPLATLTDGLAPDDVVLLHLSMGSRINEIFRSLDCRKVILYHNVTPPEFFDQVQPEMAEHLRRGQRQAASLAGVADVNLADSRFNAGELEGMGYRDVGVVPIVLDLDVYNRPGNPVRLDLLPTAGTTLLFVGRCAPNKAIGDLIHLFTAYHRHVNPDSRFIHVGAYDNMAGYYTMMKAQARKLGLDAFHMMGAVSDDELISAYRMADQFVCLSSHEGFCIPLLEAMTFDLPVLATAAGAVPETLDGAGILIRERNLQAIAELIDEVRTNEPLRHEVLAGQRRRLDRYRQLDAGNLLRQALAPVL